MPHYNLLLYPVTALLTAPQTDVIAAALQQCGLISSESSTVNYPAGNRLLELLSFLGCAPNINLTPEQGDNFCHVLISPWKSGTHYLGHVNNALPRCPQCKATLPQWQDRINWQLGNTPCHCSNCNTHSTMLHLNWKQQGAYSCMAVEIINIHPFEAAPSEELLNVLQTVTNVEWSYCYTSTL
jgi:hypothetical protein